MSIMENSSIKNEILSVVPDTEVKGINAAVKISDIDEIETVNNNQDIQKTEDVSEKQRQLTAEEKNEIVDDLNKAVELFNNDIRFVKNSDVEDKTVYVEVYNKETGEVIRRIPPENLKQSLKNISELTGLLIDQIG